MTGTILIPKLYQTSYPTVGRYMPFFRRIEKEFGWEIQFCNDVNPHRIKTEYVMSFKSPQKHDGVGLMESLCWLPPDKKLICYITDIHGGPEGIQQDDRYFRNMNRMLTRADLVLCPYYSQFKILWSQYAEKCFAFPHFFVEEYFSKPLNQEPIPRCLVSGAMFPKYYPFRVKAAQDKNVIQLGHCGYADSQNNPSVKTGQEYADELRRYWCGLATSSVLNYTLGKYFEIPAAGSLLLGEETPDLKAYGFKPGVNYIRVNRRSFSEILEHVLANRAQYEPVRRAGMDFVRSQYSDANALERFKLCLSWLNSSVGIAIANASGVSRDMTPGSRSSEDI